jgi:hypothetical protein
MEDYVWIFVVAAVWLFEITSKGIKKQSQSSGDEVESSRPDPRSTERNLSREMDASARHAEDALQRWEAKQKDAAVVPAPVGFNGPRSKTQRRKESFEAIAAMLAPPADKTAPAPRERHKAMAVEDRTPARAVRKPSPLPPVVESAPTPIEASRRGGLRQLAGLPEMQRAVVLSEILGPPVSLAGGSAFHPDPD